MAELVAVVVAVAAAVGLTVFLAGGGYLVDPDVLAWRRIAEVRGFADASTVADRLEGRYPFLARLFASFHVPRNLLLAGARQSPRDFHVRSVVMGLGVGVGILLLDAALLPSGGGAPIPPVFALLLAVGIGGVAYVDLPARVARRRQRLGDGVIDMLVPFTVITATEAVPERLEALRLLSRCLRQKHVRDFLQDPVLASSPHQSASYRALVQAPPKDNVELLRAIGVAYDLPIFSELGDREAETRRSTARAAAFGQLARDRQLLRIQDDEERAELSRSRVQVPMAGIILPILILVLVPLMISITEALQ